MRYETLHNTFSSSGNGFLRELRSARDSGDNNHVGFIDIHVMDSRKHLHRSRRYI